MTTNKEQQELTTPPTSLDYPIEVMESKLKEVKYCLEIPIMKVAAFQLEAAIKILRDRKNDMEEFATLKVQQALKAERERVNRIINKAIKYDPIVEEEGEREWNSPLLFILSKIEGGK